MVCIVLPALNLELWPPAQVRAALYDAGLGEGERRCFQAGEGGEVVDEVQERVGLAEDVSTISYSPLKPFPPTWTFRVVTAISLV